MLENISSNGSDDRGHINQNEKYYIGKVIFLILSPWNIFTFCIELGFLLTKQLFH